MNKTINLRKKFLNENVVKTVDIILDNKNIFWKWIIENARLVVGYAYIFTDISGMLFDTKIPFIGEFNLKESNNQLNCACFLRIEECTQ